MKIVKRNQEGVSKGYSRNHGPVDYVLKTNKTSFQNPSSILSLSNNKNCKS